MSIPRISVALFPMCSGTALAGPVQNGLAFEEPIVVELEPEGFWIRNIEVADVDQDGYADLVVARSFTIEVRRGDGRGGFSELIAAMPAPTGGYEIVRVADMNGDCLPDLHVVQPGETWNFQGWFRDFGSNNFSDAVSVLFH